MVGVVPQGFVHAGELCLKPVEGPIDVSLYAFLPKMAQQVGGTGLVLTITNGDRWWHHREPGLWYEPSTTFSYIGANVSFAEVLCLFMKKFKIFPVVELTKAPQPVAEWMDKKVGGLATAGRGPILLYDPLRPAAVRSVLVASARKRKQAENEIKDTTKVKRAKREE